LENKRLIAFGRLGRPRKGARPPLTRERGRGKMGIKRGKEKKRNQLFSN